MSKIPKLIIQSETEVVLSEKGKNPKRNDKKIKELICELIQRQSMETLNAIGFKTTFDIISNDGEFIEIKYTVMYQFKKLSHGISIFKACVDGVDQTVSINSTEYDITLEAKDECDLGTCVVISKEDLLEIL